MSLVWYDLDGKKRIFDLKEGKTFRIGRKGWKLVIQVEDKNGNVENLVPMNVINPYVSRINPEINKHGSVVINYKSRGMIEVFRAKNSKNPVRVLELNPSHASVAKAYLAGDPGIEIPYEESSRGYTPKLGLTEIYVRDANDDENLLVKLYTHKFKG